MDDLDCFGMFWQIPGCGSRRGWGPFSTPKVIKISETSILSQGQLVKISVSWHFIASSRIVSIWHLIYINIPYNKYHGRHINSPNSKIVLGTCLRNHLWDSEVKERAWFDVDNIYMNLCKISQSITKSWVQPTYLSNPVQPLNSPTAKELHSGKSTDSGSFRASRCWQKNTWCWI